MHGYRLYFLSSEDRIRGVEQFVAASDGDALARSHRILSEQDTYPGFEVWQGARLLTFGRRGDLEKPWIIGCTS